PHHRAQRNVHYIVAGPTAVREACGIAAENSERILRRRRFRSDARVQAQHLGWHDTRGLVESRDAREENLNQIRARERRRLDAGKAEQRFDESRQGRIRHVTQELGIILRLTAVKPILVLVANDDLVYEWIPQPGHLDEARACWPFAFLVQIVIA